MFSLYHKDENLVSVAKQLIKKLKISVHGTTIERELSEHPDYPSLLALSDCLNQWSITNHSYFIAKEDYDANDLLFPFVAHLSRRGGEFILVKSISGNKVQFANEQSETLEDTEEKFLKSWSGYMLHAAASSYSGEKDYKRTWFRSMLKSMSLPLGLLILSALLGLTTITNGINWYTGLITVSKMLGITVSVLLLLQSLDANNPLIKNLCSLGGNNDCNVILKSDAANVTSWLTWTEVGFFYFTGTFILLLLSPSSASLLRWLNLLALPYTVYSISYQYRSKNWCILCCTVQALLVAEATIFAFAEIPLFAAFGIGIEGICMLVISFLSPVFAWSALKPVFIGAGKERILKSQLKKFKFNVALFSQNLKSQPKYAVNSELKPVALGNPAAETVITMISNPYCGPCAKAHKVLDEWLQFRNDLQVKVVFTSTDDETSPKTKVSRHLSALSNHYDAKVVEQALNEWYNSARKDFQSWSAKYPVVVDGEVIRASMLQKEWVDMADVEYTPTFLINGYKLPEQYALEDIKYLLE